MPDEKLRICIYNGDENLSLDKKSPNLIHDRKVSIPYLNNSFYISNKDLTFEELFDQYLRLIKEIDQFKDYSFKLENDIIDYIDRLLEIARNNSISLNQSSIYLNYLENIVGKFKRDLEYSILLENVENKVKTVKENELFVIDTDYRNYDFDELKEFHSNLIEKYVTLNRNHVIEECFINLKFEGIYTSNEKLADELIEKAHDAMDNRDYDELFNITNLLYELDERE